jgi:N-acetyl-1-D-myo-inositol-2-amino-2-deoxy-alpha-D-glucopyranoside deacetylase
MQHMSSHAEPERLGVGATLLSSVFALLVGGVVGAIATFTHRQFLPWGLVGGLLVVLALVVGFRLVFDSRAVAAASAIGVVAASAVLTLPGAGGRALVVDDLAGWIWALGPAILSAIALVWPRPRIRPAAESEAVPLAD